MANLIHKNRSEVIRRLTELRDEISRRSGLENYKVLKYETIELIASAMPASLDELGDIKGIGPKKLAQYGAMILKVVNNEVKKQPELEFRESKPEIGDEVYSVDEFLDRVNDVLYDGFRDCYVQGEISGLSERPSGYFFSLSDKDEDAVLSCYLPPAAARMVGFALEDGMEVKVSGGMNIWKPKGRLSYVVSTLELVGEGALKKAYEALKAKLEAEGLFERKRPLPELIQRIGIITSAKGAVIHDFRTNIVSRGLELKLYDVRVEGAHAASEIVRAIQYFNTQKDDFDVLVVMRGGGSLEDLMAFNHEQVARAVFGSGLPTIAAVGHDKDVPIVNLTADREVSTPTAAAVLVNESWQLFEERLKGGVRLLSDEIDDVLEKRYFKLSLNTNTIVRSLDRIRDSYMNRIRAFGQHIARTREHIKFRVMGLENTGNNISREIRTLLSDLRSRLNGYADLIASQDPERVMRLGYSYARDEQGRILRDVADISEGETVETRLHKGSFTSKITNKRK